MAHFRSAQNNLKLGPKGLKLTNELCRLNHIPNVNTKAQHLSLIFVVGADELKKIIHHVRNRSRNGELKHASCMGDVITRIATHVGH